MNTKINWLKFWKNFKRWYSYHNLKAYDCIKHKIPYLYKQKEYIEKYIGKELDYSIDWKTLWKNYDRWCNGAPMWRGCIRYGFDLEYLKTRIERQLEEKYINKSTNSR